MQATLDAAAIKPFTRALTCLSKYGEEMTIYATPNAFSLSTVNSAKSAYCRFKFSSDFFSKYRVDAPLSDSDTSSDVEEITNVTGQLLTKALLSILRHRTVDKSAERCEFSITEGMGAPDDEEQDGLESKLVVKLFCKHGVVKTHRLLLMTTTSLMTPNISTNAEESTLTVAPKALKDMIEHFSLNKGAKSDPQLIWKFSEEEITLKTMESSLEGKGRSGLSSELTLSVEEFDSYEISESPITIAFHLRELNATIAFAESVGALLDIHFTEPTAPLFIDVEGLSIDSMFVISTIHAPGEGSTTGTQSTTGPVRKREREETPQEQPRNRKSMKVVQTTPIPSGARSNASDRSHSVISARPPPSSAGRTTSSWARGVAASTPQSHNPHEMPPPPPPPSTGRSTPFWADHPAAQSTPQPHNSRDMPPPPVPFKRMQYISPPPAGQDAEEPQEEEPLFLPSSSQLSQSEVNFLRSGGLGDEEMDADDLAAMLEGEGEEVAFDFASQPPPQSQDAAMDADNDEFVGTQTSYINDSSKDFHPLFED
ncbi:Rad9-domain-containing protein [Coprinopsis sp. MPI-PUGE-AT-0042]|nr:Rad9-domain-containing protein [Coprinopsis sp. MPI-PUGE-AT-0042]